MLELRRTSDGRPMIVFYGRWYYTQKWAAVRRAVRLGRRSRTPDTDPRVSVHLDLVDAGGGSLVSRVRATRRLLQLRLQTRRASDPPAHIVISQPRQLAWLPYRSDLSVRANSTDSPEWQDLVSVIGKGTNVESISFTDRPPFTPEERGRSLTNISVRPVSTRVSLPRPLGVFAHMYYVDLAVHLARWLESLDHPYALYLTTDTQEKAAFLGRLFSDAQIKVTPNRGRDVGAKLTAFVAEHDDHDVVLHVHGKRSLHLAAPSQALHQEFTWAEHIERCIFANAETVHTILNMFEELPHLGMVGPSPWAPVYRTVKWGPNRPIADLLAYAAGWNSLPPDGSFHFPVGSMFWARPKALRPLLDLGLKPSDFPPEDGQLDGTLAHAIERLYGVVTLSQGLDYISFAGLPNPVNQRAVVMETVSDVRHALQGPFTPVA